MGGRDDAAGRAVLAFAVWNAFGTLIPAAPLGLNALGWFLWVFTTVFPLSRVLTRVRSGISTPPLQFALVLLTGLALTAVFWLDVVAYTTTHTSSLLS